MEVKFSYLFGHLLAFYAPKKLCEQTMKLTNVVAKWHSDSDWMGTKAHQVLIFGNEIEIDFALDSVAFVCI